MTRAWMALIWNSFGVAVLAAAAQLEVADALGIVRWSADSASTWSALLTWVAFIYALAVLSGATVGRRALRRARPSDRAKPTDTALARVLAAFLAGLGATAATSLAWLQAKSIGPGVSAYPELRVASIAGAGIVIGTLLALIAAAVAPIAANVRATIAWVWLVGIGCALTGYLTRRPFPAPRLAVVDAPSLVPAAWWSGPNLMIAIGVVLGVVVAALARRAGGGRAGVALSGFAGPAVIAAAYVITDSGLGNAAPANLDLVRTAGLAVAVGLLGSVLVAMVPRRDAPATPATGPSAAADLDDESTWALATQNRAPTQGLMGQPSTSFEEDYSDWLRGLGNAPAGHSDPAPRSPSY